MQSRGGLPLQVAAMVVVVMEVVLVAMGVLPWVGEAAMVEAPLWAATVVVSGGSGVCVFACGMCM